MNAVRCTKVVYIVGLMYCITENCSGFVIIVSSPADDQNHCAHHTLGILLRLHIVYQKAVLLAKIKTDLNSKP